MKSSCIVTFLIVLCFQRSEHSDHLEVSAYFGHIELSLFGVVIMAVIVIAFGEDLQDVVDHFLSVFRLVCIRELVA